MTFLDLNDDRPTARRWFYDRDHLQTVLSQASVVAYSSRDRRFVEDLCEAFIRNGIDMAMSGAQFRRLAAIQREFGRS